MDQHNNLLLKVLCQVNPAVPIFTDEDVLKEGKVHVAKIQKSLNCFQPDPTWKGSPVRDGHVQRDAKFRKNINSYKWGRGLRGVGRGNMTKNCIKKFSFFLYMYY